MFLQADTASDFGTSASGPRDNRSERAGVAWFQRAPQNVRRFHLPDRTSTQLNTATTLNRYNLRAVSVSAKRQILAKEDVLLRVSPNCKRGYNKASLLSAGNGTSKNNCCS